MKIGIIIVFHDNENDIDREFFIEYLNKTKNMEVCLVNNASRDNTYILLKEIKDSCKIDISLVDIKKLKSEIYAVRSGARFMFNAYDLDHIGFINMNLLSSRQSGINKLLEEISENQELILNYNIKMLNRKEIKQTLFKSIFSILEYLDKLKINSQLIKL